MNTKTHFKDPVIRKDDAIKAGVNSNRLSKLLGVSRSSISAWKEVVPELQAYRLIQIFPHLDNRS